MKIQPIGCRRNEKVIELQDREFESRDAPWLTESEQRELLVYIKKNNPSMMREIFCEDCPEHIGDVS